MILSSRDGRDWTLRASVTSRWLLAVAYHPRLRLFAAVGEEGLVLTSSDGVTWTRRHTGGARWNGIGITPDQCFFVVGEGVAPGEAGEPVVSSLVSADGLIWTRSPLPSGWLRGVASGHGKLLVAGRGGALIDVPSRAAMRYASSPRPAQLEGTGSRDLEAVAFGRRTFVAVGAQGTVVVRPIDAPCEYRTSSHPGGLRAVEFFNNQFVAAGDGGLILASPDGRSWEQRATPTGAALHALAASADTLVAVGANGTVLRSAREDTMPVLLASPASQQLAPGDSSALRVVAGGGPLRYQWFKDGAALAGQSRDVLVLTEAKASDAGNYTARIFNDRGAVTSVPAKVAFGSSLANPIDEGFAPTTIPSKAPALIVPLADGRIVLGGDFMFGACRGLARLLADGRPDPAFAPGEGIDQGAVLTVVPSGDGTMYVGGTFTAFNGVSGGALIRLRSDGSVDATFSAAAIATREPPDANGRTGVRRVAETAEGKLLVLTPASELVRLNRDGSRDMSFTAALNRVRAFALLPDGRVAAGDLRAVLLHPDGTLDPSGGTASGGSLSQLSALRVAPDGSLIVGFDTLNVISIVGGKLDPGVGTAYSWTRRLRHYVGAVGFETGHAVIAAFEGNTVGGLLNAPPPPAPPPPPDSHEMIAGIADGGVYVGGVRYLPSGQRDSGFNVDLLRPTAIAVQADGKLLVAGEFEELNLGTDRSPPRRPRIARLRTDLGSSPPPEIVAASVTSAMVGDGGTVRFEATAVGAGRLTYDWRWEGVFDGAEPRATAIFAPENAVRSLESGLVTLQVHGSMGVATGEPTYLSVVRGGLRIEGAPALAVPGRTVVLQAVHPLLEITDYEWWRDSQRLAERSGTLTLRAVDARDAGSYVVHGVDRSGARVRSEAVRVAVGSGTQITNLAARARTAPGADVLTLGFVVVGDRPKNVLIRGVGPTLGQFGVEGVLADPVLRVFRSGQAIAMNDDWSRGAEPALLADRLRDAGAFALPAGSRDAALEITLEPRVPYTVEITGGSGVALAELYDPDRSTTRFGNLSLRAYVGTEAGVAIPGFVVEGNAPRQFLVRSVGPGLAPFGVGGVLVDPELRVVDAGGRTVATNDNWSESPAAVSVRQATGAAGAFPLADASKDAALVVSLAPGAYTVVTTGAGGGKGVALMEVYELP